MQFSPDRRIAGVLAPGFAIRSANDLGIGDVDSLRQLVDWAAEAGFGLVQLLPINETGSDNSPYMAVSSVAIEPATIHVSPESIPDLSRKEFDAMLSRIDLDRLRRGPVNYREIKPLKRSLLWKSFESFHKKELTRNTTRARKFRAFMKDNFDWLDDYTLFRVLMDRHGSGERWDLWPREQMTAAAAQEWLRNEPRPRWIEIDRQRKFYAYVQWIAFGQWRSLREHAEKKGVALMGDVPFGISYYSADVFAHPELFDLKWSGGAPPEPFFKDDAFTQKWGQNWGVPMYNWEAMRDDDFAWWRQRVRMVREIFDLFRVDHVLGFYRIYSFPWRPDRNGEFLPLSHDQARAKTGGELPRFLPRDDASAENREANRRQGEEILRVLLGEVGEFRLIGEDLGVVPDYVRPNLTSLGIAGFKIPMWEREQHGGFSDCSRYPRLSVVTYATHDHEPLRATWEKMRAAAEQGDQQAFVEMRRTAEFAGFQGELPQAWNSDLHEAALRALFRSNSWIAICMITDLFGGTQRFNVPGAIADSNWSERLADTVSSWRSNARLRTKIERVRDLLRDTGRLNAG